MARFDQFIAVDYSGSASIAAQRRHIVMAFANADGFQTHIRSGMSRMETTLALFASLVDATKTNRRVCIGIDHAFGFPHGLIDAMARSTSSESAGRKTALDVVSGRVSFVPCGIGEAVSNRARQHLQNAFRDDEAVTSVIDSFVTAMRAGHSAQSFAALINQWCMACGLTSAGPFWGPSFSPQMKKPQSLVSPWHETRVTDALARHHGFPASPIFQLGGHGSVGLQSLYGMRHVAALSELCQQERIPLHLWPFEGEMPHESSHVLVEMYPAMFNRGEKSDERDARLSAAGMARFCRHTTNPFAIDDSLIDLPNAPILATTDFHQTVHVEGWIFGLHSEFAMDAVIR